jgi:hypothetical protein
MYSTIYIYCGNGGDVSICSELPVPNYQYLVNDSSGGDIYIPSFFAHPIGFVGLM